jgi:hypothetical protein
LRCEGEESLNPTNPYFIYLGPQALVVLVKRLCTNASFKYKGGKFFT